SITPADATNPVNAPHTVTATVMINRGDGNGFVIDVGAAVTITLTNQGGAVATPAGPFTGTTDASGQFQVTFTSATAGTGISVATTTLTLNGHSITRTTGDGYSTVGGSDSNSAVKHFIANGTLCWIKEDNQGHLLGGATFLVTGPNGFSESVTDNSPPDTDP